MYFFSLKVIWKKTASRVRTISTQIDRRTGGETEKTRCLSQWPTVLLSTGITIQTGASPELLHSYFQLTALFNLNSSISHRSSPQIELKKKDSLRKARGEITPEWNGILVISTFPIDFTHGKRPQLAKTDGFVILKVIDTSDVTLKWWIGTNGNANWNEISVNINEPLFRNVTNPLVNAE